MGLIAVDLKDGKRIPRDSYYYYQKVIKNNMVD
jgi:beta-glucosidase/6-phospho-beta-glucosidase/beta-galactosidase